MLGPMNRLFSTLAPGAALRRTARRLPQLAVPLFVTIACRPSGKASAPPPSIAHPAQSTGASSAAPPPAPHEAGARTAQQDGGPDAQARARRDAAADAPPAEPPLRGADGGVLPQTHARPNADSALFKYHSRLLWRAIVKDDPSVAMPFFFPVLAYQQVKDIAKPARDWKYRLVAAFKRTIHDYHRRLGRYRDRCVFVRIEVPEQRARWMKRESEGNKLSYWRVLDSVLHYRDAHGRPRELGITSLISWRGQWYVVHLHGFK